MISATAEQRSPRAADMFHFRRIHPFLAVLLVLAGETLAAGPSWADAVSDFYNKKTLTLIAGFPPGGGYDTYVRLLARHYGRFIPGNPQVVPSNMPGAGSMTAANRIYQSEPKDGT